MAVDLRQAGLEALPGADIIQEGLHDLAAGRKTAYALLVSIGAPRLRRSGLQVPATLHSPEDGLYRLLEEEHGTAAHSQYNALIRRLVSFERSLESVKR
jgi:hypothetical protein